MGKGNKSKTADQKVKKQKVELMPIDDSDSPLEEEELNIVPSEDALANALKLIQGNKQAQEQDDEDSEEEEEDADASDLGEYGEEGEEEQDEPEILGGVQEQAEVVQVQAEGVEGEDEEDSESSSEEDILDFNEQHQQKVLGKRPNPEDGTDPREEVKEKPRALIRHETSSKTNVRPVGKLRKPGKDEVEVELEYVQPSGAYYFAVKTFMQRYLDGEEMEKLDLAELADHICERASIGQVVVSPLDPSKDPELIPELQSLSDEEFQKQAEKYNSERDVFGFSTILSLTYVPKGKRKQPNFLGQLKSYAMAKAEKYMAKGVYQQFAQVMKTKNIGLLVTERLINLPSEIVPSLHTELPGDLDFTKEQDDITDLKEFDYQYLLVISKYTIPNTKSKKKQQAASLLENKRQKVDNTVNSSDEKRFYKWEDSVLWPASDHSFSYLTTFRVVDDEGNKQSINSSSNEPETQHMLVYLIKWDIYLRKIKQLQKMVV